MLRGSKYLRFSPHGTILTGKASSDQIYYMTSGMGYLVRAGAKARQESC
jgi:hypothetical protein